MVMDTAVHTNNHDFLYSKGQMHPKQLAYVVYSAIGFWSMSTSIGSLFFTGRGTPRFCLAFVRSLAVRTHALCGALLLITLIIWWTPPFNVIGVPLFFHTMTGFVLLPDIHQVKVTSWTMVLLALSVNSWELLQSMHHPWMAVDHDWILHSLAGFTNARFWVAIFKIAGFEGATYSTGMMMAGWVCLILGLEYGLISYWSVSTMSYCFNGSIEGVLKSTISQIMNSSKLDENKLHRATSKLKSHQVGHPRTLFGAHSQAAVNFMDAKSQCPHPCSEVDQGVCGIAPNLLRTLSIQGAIKGKKDCRSVDVILD